MRNSSVTILRPMAFLLRMVNSMAEKRSSNSGWIAATLVLALLAPMAWNPVDYFWEAGDSAYYQARQVYMRGSEADRHAVVAAFGGKRITVHDYSAVIFPAYIRVVKSGESPYPEAERQKTRGQQRADLVSVIGAGQ
ncbi:hypothetical protein [Duganella vulcania]|uniref:Uncharacterized protein n=1 Tax=Duganella vulcania TaxID=2692166 RepID=A0A845GI64_9BURK|nr:hypothetical protein [Duganella vulcania]MYM92457.1 hypothetical protein [Duganella vulcania]